MSDDAKEDKEREKARGQRTGNVFAGVGIFLLVGLVAAVFVGPHLYGTTPTQLMDEPLACSPKQLGRDLPMTTVSSHGVRVTFRKGAAGEYEEADFDWTNDTTDAPSSMRLRAEHGAKVAAEATAAIRRWLPHFQDGRYRWGPVTLRVRDRGDVSFDVDREINGKPNPLFLRQIEAAKQIVLNAAFNIPVRVSEREIEDALGAGYALADLAKLDTQTPVENAAATMRAAFPAAATSDSSTFYVPVDHPLVDKVRLQWENRAGGRLESIGWTMNKSYPDNRASLESCMERKLGAPHVDVTDYAGGRKSYRFAVGKIRLELGERSVVLSFATPVDPTSFALLFQTLDGCRDTAESGPATK